MNIAKAIEATLTTGNSNKTQFKKLNGEKTKRRDANGLYSANEFHDNRPADYTESADGDFLTNLDPTTPEAKQWQGWGTALKPAHEPMVLARKPLISTVANNVLTFGVGGLNIDGTRVEGDKGTGNWKGVTTPDQSDNIYAGGWDGSVQGQEPITDTGTIGRFPANFIHDGSDEVVALFPDVKGKVGVQRLSDFRFNVGETETGAKFASQAGLGDSGSAARFFYCAKASKRDRNEGLDGFEAKRDHDGRKDGGVGGDNPRNRTNNAKLNHHPTVKPTSLMQYLIRLVTPPNGIVLDPFMGSGSTGKACAYEGFEFIGIDQSAEYVAIAQARIDSALADKATELPL
jgi:site-specific DNA-methyltransferase (adenine-specific)